MLKTRRQVYLTYEQIEWHLSGKCWQAGSVGRAVSLVLTRRRRWKLRLPAAIPKAVVKVAK